MCDLVHAEALFCNEHDKISNYPDIHNFIVHNFEISCTQSCIARCAALESRVK
jgi:hypothetical protein